MTKFTFVLICFGILSIPIASQTFTDVTSSSFIDHTFEQSRQMGGGVVFFDYDNDGWEDLYITSGKGKDQLYKNMSGITFQKIATNWLDITEDYYTIAVVSGDINNDGLRDLFVSTWDGSNNTNGLQNNLLFINKGGGLFEEKSSDYNLTEKSFTMGVSMFDYNADGLLDLYAVNYVDDVQIDFENENEQVSSGECHPNLFYINNGNNTFTENSVAMSLDDTGCALAVMPTDYNQDGYQDIYIANDFGAYIEGNKLYHNELPTENKFSEKAASLNMDVSVFAMGIAYADIDKDDDYDYYVTNLGRNVLIENNGNQGFSDITTNAGVENTYTIDTQGNLHTTGWGTAFLDVNNDTWPDLFVANGRVVATAETIVTGETDPNKLYLNNGDSTFSDITNTAGVGDTNRGRGMAYCDYDKDGDLDVFVVVQDESADPNAKSKLYRNELNPNGSDNNNWVQFDLEGTSINKDAIGAKVEITVGGETLIQEVHGQGSHCSQHSLVLHFGLGSSTTVDNVEVIWSNNSTQTFNNISVNQRYNIIEGQMTLSVDDNTITKTSSFFPNPVENKLYFTTDSTITYAELHSITGQLIAKLDINAVDNFLDLPNLEPNIYVLSYRINGVEHKHHELIIKK